MELEPVPPRRTPLAAFGIEAGADEVYRLLLRTGGSSVAILADRVGRTFEAVSADVAVLVRAGLVRAMGASVVAQPPEESIGRLVDAESGRLARGEAALAMARLGVHQYVAEFRAGRPPGRAAIPLEVVEPGEIAELMATLVGGTTGEMLFVRPDQWRLPSGLSTDGEVLKALSAGRRSRAVYPRTLLLEDAPVVFERAAKGEQVRLLAALPSRLSVFGTEAVVVPEAWGRTSSRVLLARQPGLVAGFRELFDQLWAHGVALTEGSGPVSHQQLLDLLAQGVKDDLIARLTGMSLRTVRRRVANLMAELGADSRFQAGAEAVRRGWL